MSMRLTGKLERRPGQMLALLCVCLGVIIAMLGLTVDGGRVMQQRRQAQSAPDFAVLTAAVALSQTDAKFSDAQDAAVQNAATNGFPNDGTRCTVTVNYPP